MARRRLRMVCCSSDEEEPQQPQHSRQQDRSYSHSQQPLQEEEAEQVEIESNETVPNIATVNLDSSVPDPVQVIVSDEEFIDVSDNLSPPSPPSPSSSPPPPSLPPTVAATPASSSIELPIVSDCPVSGCLRRLGLSLREEWLYSCIQGLKGAVQGFSSFDVDTKAKICFGEALFEDLNCIGAGVLPENVNSLHLVDLSGPFVLQVDEIANISCPLRQRYQDAPAGLKRCLKLSMTDGIQRVFGMEYRPIEDLEVLAPAGFKVVIRNVNVRHGLLMLVPEVLEVLGGSVEELEGARQRLVHEVNKPPRGKRSRTGAVPPLATRATLAAWPSNGINHSLNIVHSTLKQSNGAASLGNRSNHILSNATSFNGDIRGPALAVTDDESMRITEESALLTRRDTTNPNLGSSAVLDIENVYMTDCGVHPVILSGDNELPFTYLASLSAKWAALKEKEPYVQGKIKCFLTGVKGFQYKQRTTFELRVHIDDGSLISEIFIHHNVVQNGIGFSPADVTAALTSSDPKRVSDMKEALKQFQIFLENFEGIMLVEMSETSALPTALEMNQGCPASDAWRLLRRLKSNASAHECQDGQPFQDNRSDPIDLSP